MPDSMLGNGDTMAKISNSILPTKSLQLREEMRLNK